MAANKKESKSASEELNNKLQEKYNELQEKYNELYKQYISLLGQKDEEFLASPAANQLREELDRANNKIALLEKKNKRLQKKNDELIEMIENPKIIHNARGAGRKSHDEKWMQTFNQFIELYNLGEPSNGIMQQMGISKSTYHRYRREALLRGLIKESVNN